MLSLLILIASQDTSDPLVRFEKYMQGAQTFSADLEFSMTGIPAIGKGSFHFKKPDQLIFIMKWGRSDYSFSIGNKQNVAIERGAKRYREYGDVGRFFMPDMDISRTPEYSLPIAFMAGSLRATVPDGIQIRGVGKGTHEGVAVDLTRAEFATQSGRVIVTSKVDAAGRALEFDKELIEEGRSVHAKIKVSNYRINMPLPDSLFNPVITSGFIPQTLPPDAYPLNVGERMPLSGWKPLGSGGNGVELATGKALFIAVSDPNCDISKAAASMVGDVAKQVKEKGGEAVAISLDPSASQKPVFDQLPNFIDPSSSLTRKLRAPGTPLFFLVTPKGMVYRVWYGFDPAKAEEFKRDVIEWVSKPPAAGR